MKGIRILFGVALAASVPSAAASTTWHDFTNVRYGFTACYPAPRLHPMPAPENGDGRSFDSPDGAGLIVYGSNDELGQGLHASIKESVDEFTSLPGHITQHLMGQNWESVTGTSGDRGFLLKAFARGDQLVTLQFVYPLAKSSIYAPMIPHLQSCFRLGTPAF